MMDIWFTAFVFLVAILVAVGASLLLVGYVNTLPASFSFGWRWWLPSLLLPVLGPFWFAWKHQKEFSMAAKQLMIGAVLVVAAAVILYGGGPYFVDRMALGIK